MPGRPRRSKLLASGPGRPAHSLIFHLILFLLIPAAVHQLEATGKTHREDRSEWLHWVETSEEYSAQQDDSLLLDSSSSMEESAEFHLASMHRATVLPSSTEHDGFLPASNVNGHRKSRRTRRHQKFEVSEEHPIHILFPLPTDEGRRNENPFGITILKAKPVVDEAIEEVYRRQLVPLNSLSIHFEDSLLSDAHGPNVAINQLVDNRLDCIIGYAFVYALAPVARMSPFWRDNDSYGIPVITSVGLTSNLDNRQEYKLMTRISSPYKVVKNAVLALFTGMNWIKSAYLFHEQRHDAANPSIPYGECYLLMASVQPHLYRKNKMEHNYFMFNELNYDHEKMNANLRRASTLSNAGRQTIRGGGCGQRQPLCNKIRLVLLHPRLPISPVPVNPHPPGKPKAGKDRWATVAIRSMAKEGQQSG